MSLFLWRPSDSLLGDNAVKQQTGRLRLLPWIMTGTVSPIHPSLPYVAVGQFLLQQNELEHFLSINISYIFPQFPSISFHW